MNLKMSYNESLNRTRGFLALFKFSANFKYSALLKFIVATRPLILRYAGKNMNRALVLVLMLIPSCLLASERWEGYFIAGIEDAVSTDADKKRVTSLLNKAKRLVDQAITHAMVGSYHEIYDLYTEDVKNQLTKSTYDRNFKAAISNIGEISGYDYKNQTYEIHPNGRFFGEHSTIFYKVNNSSVEGIFLEATVKLDTTPSLLGFFYKRIYPNTPNWLIEVNGMPAR